MASSLLRTTFVPSFYSHHQDVLSFPSSLGLSTTTAPLPGELKFNRVIVAQDNNASDGQRAPVNRGHITRQNGQQVTKCLNFSGEKPSTPILDTINYPMHMKNLSLEELEVLANEIREEIVYTVSKTGGHLSSSLGVAELTVALHHVFNCPEDKIIWDVGHQAYPHKILTGRRSRMHTIRQTCGLAGFPKRDESVYDAFGAGHSSTSISAGLGMAVARDLLGKKNHVISVIGDGAMTAGQAYEAMNNAGYLDSNLIIILNDNEQVSLPTATLDGPAPPVGALSRSLTRLQASRKFRQLREVAKGITKQIGGQAHGIASKVDTYMRGMVGGAGACFFEELGLYYIGPVDGHNVEDLVHIMKSVKAMPAPGPVLIRIITEKGKGYAPAEVASDKMHGVVKFDPKSGKQLKTKSATRSYTQKLQLKNCLVFVDLMQVAHDVDLQRLPVRFAIDRAGLVGADGPTHCGAFDTTFLACLPNMVVMAPSNETELMHMVATAAAIDDRPSCFRYPRGSGVGSILPPNNKGTPLEVLQIYTAELLQGLGISTTVADARFCKPLDGDLIRRLAQEHEILITVEEGSIGGFSSHVSHFLGLNGLLDGNLKAQHKLKIEVLPSAGINPAGPTTEYACDSLQT
ncbi:hypothetical protein FH972_013528 [Carpinus fangiana]|uniref:1-deoxy-D-xylulose-5-phosphate synthase n=1 Tax=Carpinus fangiana TaxID=176857 RepID=A0A5N6R716_9ROSI|nr:hypothetical protein FH972_013528 [Carpinus fangiana]